MGSKVAYRVSEVILTFTDVQRNLAIPGKGILFCVTEKAGGVVELAQGPGASGLLLQDVAS